MVQEISGMAIFNEDIHQQQQQQQQRSILFHKDRHPPLIDVEMPFNPFINSNSGSSSTSVYEASKTLLLLPLFVFRASMFTLTLALGLLLTRVALLGATEVLAKPFPAWRRKLLWPVRLLARLLLFFCGFHWITIRGTPARKHEAAIFVCNHVTFVEPVYLFYKHLPVFVTAAENLEFPMMGSLIKAMQPIALDRDFRESRRDAAAEIRRRASGGWNRVMIFPEATTTNGRALISFKLGAFGSRCAIQPLVVKFPHVHLDPSWVAVGPSVYYLLFRLMTQFQNHMEIEYLPVMEPTFQEQQNPRAFSERVRARMAKCLNVAVTEHTFEDLAMVTEARKARSEVSLLEFGRFQRLYKMSSKEAKRFFHKFRALDVRKKGMVTLDDLMDYLELPDCVALRRLYQLFDSKGSGYFNFRQYAAGLLFIVRFERFREATEAAFKYCDRDGDSKLSNAEFWLGMSSMLPSLTQQQAKVLWDRMNVNQAKFVPRLDFLTFLERNPEFIAVLLEAKPELLLANDLQLSMD